MSIEKFFRDLVEKNYSGVVEYIENGGKINVKCDGEFFSTSTSTNIDGVTNFTPITAAIIDSETDASRGETIKIVKYLIDNGAEILRESEDDGWCPFFRSGYMQLDETFYMLDELYQRHPKFDRDYRITYIKNIINELCDFLNYEMYPEHESYQDTVCNLIDILVSEGVSVDFIGMYENNYPLYSATKQRLYKIIEKLLESGANINGIGRESPLSRAGRAADIDMVKLFLKWGAEPNTALYATIRYLSGMEMQEILSKIVDLLLEAGADPLANDIILLYCVDNGIADITAKLLKSKKFNPTKIYSDGFSILDIFISRKNVEWVEKLLDMGANVQLGYPIYTAVGNYPEIIDRLVELGATIKNFPTEEINGRKYITSIVDNVYVREPIFYAISKENIAGVRAAVKLGTDPNSRNINGDTPLMALIKIGNKRNVQIMQYLAPKTDPTIRNNDGKTVHNLMVDYGWLRKHIVWYENMLRKHYINEEFNKLSVLRGTVKKSMNRTLPDDIMHKILDIVVESRMDGIRKECIND